MKKLVCFMMLFALVANAEIIGGPKGGKLLEKGELRAEFFVDNERHAVVTLYDADLNVITPTEQTVKVFALTTGTNGKPTIEMEQSNDHFISTTALPDEDGYTIAVQIKESAGGKKSTFRINYHSEICGECDRGEYACICDHSGDDGHGH